MDEDDDRLTPSAGDDEWSDLEAESEASGPRSRWEVAPLAPGSEEGPQAPVNPAVEDVSATADVTSAEGRDPVLEAGSSEPSETPSAGGRRQARKPGSPRRNVHQVKVTDEAERQLVARAGERGITVSRLLLESALAGGSEAAKTKAELAGELFRTNRLLLKLGVNMNQIAAATNATLEEQPEHVAALAAVTRLSGRIEDLLDEIQLPADYDRTRAVPGHGAVDAEFRVVRGGSVGTGQQEDAG